MNNNYKNLACAMLLCWLVLAPLSALWATNYYVATNGSDQNAGTSVQTAFRTINRANTVAKAGDVVHIRGGIYYERVVVRNSGEPGKPLVFCNYGDEKPIIDGSGQTAPDWDLRGLFQITSKKYVIVEGLRVQNVMGLGRNGNGIYVAGPNAAHITIRQCSTDNTGSSGIAAWGNTPEGRYDGIRHLLIEGCVISRALMDGYQECLTVSQGVEDFDVSYNTVHDSGRGYLEGGPLGIDTKFGVRNGVVHHNYVYNINNASGIYVDAWDRDTYNIEVYNNTVHNTDHFGISIGSEERGPVHDIKIYNNVVHDCGYSGITISGYNHGPNTISRVDVYHNTVYNNKHWGIIVEDPTVDGRVYNNIFMGHPWAQMRRISPNITADHNLISGYGHFGTDNIIGDPKFVDIDNRNLQLAGGSPAIDAGASRGAPATDITDKARPIGRGVDIGAYEYGQAPTGLPTPWKSRNIGTTSLKGNAAYGQGRFTVAASGADIWDTADGFRFVYRSWSGDGQFTAKVASMQNTHEWAKAGVMIREALAPGAKHAFTLVTPDNNTAFQRRASTKGASTHTGGPGNAPYWVRLTRIGNTIVSAVSANGSQWVEIGRENLRLSQDLYVGLAVTAHNDGALCKAVFENVSVSRPEAIVLANSENQETTTEASAPNSKTWDDALAVFPSPSYDGRINLATRSPQAVAVWVATTTGKAVYQGWLNQGTMQTLALKPGVYVAVFRQGNKVTRRKIMVL